jgi:hypothetical protein
MALACEAYIEGFAFDGETIYAELYNLYIKYMVGSHIGLAVYSPLLKV